MERPGATTMRGKPLTLVGPELKSGDKAPDFDAVTEMAIMFYERLTGMATQAQPSGMADSSEQLAESPSLQQ